MLYVGDADFSTDIMGNSLESNVALDVRYLSLLAIDDVNSHQHDLHEAKGVSYWKVSKSKSLRQIITLIERCSHLDMLSSLRLRGRILHLMSPRLARFTWTYVSRSIFLLMTLIYP